MVIEHAERFGLAQLHQLRGRVGRGDEASTCILLYKSPLSEAGRARLSVLRESEDGFLIAEEDLKLRGEGELLGTRQSGTPGFLIASLEAHDKIEDERAGGVSVKEIAEQLKLKLVTVDAVDASGKDQNGDEVKDLPEPRALLQEVFKADVGTDTLAVNIGRDGSACSPPIEACRRATVARRQVRRRRRRKERPGSG